MKTVLSIKYIDEENYSIGLYKDGKLNGWGAKVYNVGSVGVIERGYFKDDKLDGLGIIYHFLEDGPKETAGLFKDGIHINVEQIKKFTTPKPYSFRSNYDGDDTLRDAIFYGELGEDGFPRGFGMVEDEGIYYYLHCDNEGYRTGIFIYPNENNSFGEYLYSINRTELNKKEWALIMSAGAGLNIKRFIKKIPLIK